MKLQATGQQGARAASEHQPLPRDKENHRIAIVGAGPSGIVCARELRKRGWKNVTVFEAHTQPGGKTRSIQVEDPATGNKAAVELGTFTILDGPVIKQILDETGLSEELINYRPVRYLKLNQAGPYHPFFPRNVSAPISRRLAELARYAASVKSAKTLDRPGFAGLKDLDLTLSIDAWLQKKRFSFLRECVLPIICTVLCGNSYDRIPVAYLMKLENIRFRLSLWRTLTFIVPRVKSGNQEIWKRAAAPLDVRYSSAVQKLAIGSGALQVHTCAGQAEFDSVVWTTGLPQLAQVLSQESAVDREPITGARVHFRKVRHIRRALLAYHVEGLPREIFWLLPEAAQKRLVAETYSLMNWPGTDWFAFYPWVDGKQTAEEMDAKVRKLVTQLGGRVIAPAMKPLILDYHPYFSSDDLGAGVYDDLEREQGRDGIYICGEVMSGITLPATSEYAKDLVERFF